MKIINRIAFSTLLIVCSISFYFSASKKSYYFGKWVPIDLLKDVGIPIKIIKTLTKNFDLVIHFTISYIATTLLLFSLINLQKINPYFFSKIILLTTSIFTFVEFYQSSVGRGFSFADILAGILGSILSILVFKLSKKLN